MDEKEFTASDFIPKDLLEIICILERGKQHHSYKIIRNRNHFALISKFPARNGEPTPLKDKVFRSTNSKSLGKETSFFRGQA